VLLPLLKLRPRVHAKKAIFHNCSRRDCTKVTGVSIDETQRRGLSFLSMKRWRISPLSLFVLLGVLTVILLVLVLPQVDLLDTAFQRNTAPVAIHVQATSAPALSIVNIPAHFSIAIQGTEYHSENRLVSVQATPKFLLILHCSIRC
jgi:hypothetical protein